MSRGAGGLPALPALDSSWGSLSHLQSLSFTLQAHNLVKVEKMRPRAGLVNGMSGQSTTVSGFVIDFA